MIVEKKVGILALGWSLDCLHHHHTQHKHTQHSTKHVPRCAGGGGGIVSVARCIGLCGSSGPPRAELSALLVPVTDEDGRALVAPALLAGFVVVVAERAVDEPPLSAAEVVADAAAAPLAPAFGAA